MTDYQRRRAFQVNVGTRQIAPNLYKEVFCSVCRYKQTTQSSTDFCYDWCKNCSSISYLKQGTMYHANRQRLMVIV